MTASEAALTLTLFLGASVFTALAVLAAPAVLAALINLKRKT